MTDPIRIEYNPKDLPKRMANFPRQFERAMGTTLEAALDELHDAVPPYPPPSGKPMKFKSEKQRRFVMALIGEGKVPYKRKGAGGLGGSFTKGAIGNVHYKRKLGGQIYEAALGTRMDHAEYVIGEKQSDYHRGTWWTLKDWKKRAIPGVNRVFGKMMTDLAQFLEGKGV